VHSGAWQVTLQTPFVQSFGARQFFPVPHLLQPLDPPQSTSVSV